MRTCHQADYGSGGSTPSPAGTCLSWDTWNQLSYLRARPWALDVEGNTTYMSKVLGRLLPQQSSMPRAHRQLQPSQGQPTALLSGCKPSGQASHSLFSVSTCSHGWAFLLLQTRPKLRRCIQKKAQEPNIHILNHERRVGDGEEIKAEWKLKEINDLRVKNELEFQ